MDRPDRRDLAVRRARRTRPSPSAKPAVPLEGIGVSRRRSHGHATEVTRAAARANGTRTAALRVARSRPRSLHGQPCGSVDIEPDRDALEADAWGRRPRREPSPSWGAAGSKCELNVFLRRDAPPGCPRPRRHAEWRGWRTHACRNSCADRLALGIPPPARVARCHRRPHQAVRPADLAPGQRAGVERRGRSRRGGIEAAHCGSCSGSSATGSGSSLTPALVRAVVGCFVDACPLEHRARRPGRDLGGPAARLTAPRPPPSPGRGTGGRASLGSRKIRWRVLGYPTGIQEAHTIGHVGGRSPSRARP